MNNTVRPLVHQPNLAGLSPTDEDTIAGGSIVLCTLNAKYIHSSLGLRYLHANLGKLRESATLCEFTINQRPIDIVETLLNKKPTVIGLGVYIWNIVQTTEVVTLLKTLAPEIIIVIGGPEVSYEYEHTEIFNRCDYLITGQADISFKELCITLQSGSKPSGKVIQSTPPAPGLLTAPYDYYTDEDIANRIVYVEASRGCPFKCEFCLSALDKTATPFDLAGFLAELDKLYQRGARQFKFVDRTFNLKIKSCISILEFFLARLDPELFVHFEVIPDKLPDDLKTALTRFPPGVLQFEVGIQSFNGAVQQTINRKQDAQKTLENLSWLRNNTHAYIHADLIAGLPGETLESFAQGFNQLVSLAPHEIQVGILKRLRGTNIVRHTETYEMCYADLPPYQLLKNKDLDFKTMQQLQRFARYWDLIANSSRFSHSLSLLLGDSPFERFQALSLWIYDTYQQTYKISQKRLFSIIHDGALALSLCDTPALHEALMKDFEQSGEKGKPLWLQNISREKTDKATSHARRQNRFTTSAR